MNPGQEHDSPDEYPEYLSSQLITYLGNKRRLLDFIGSGVERVKARLGRPRLSTFDVFSGSGIVARYLRRHSHLVVANDLEYFSAVINQCYLASPDPELLNQLRDAHRWLLSELTEEALQPGFIRELYSPQDEHAIGPHERVFYTPRNACFLDSARPLIDQLPVPLRPFFLAPLLSEASIHANTSGVFKGYYKNSRTGCGQFGGNNQNALKRIVGPMTIPFPLFSRFPGEARIFQQDAGQLAASLDEVDLAYLDPPYNKHPYGSNYFMLNLVARYQRPGLCSRVSGIPEDWNRSDYNRRSLAQAALHALINNLRARFLLISFNSEGFISPDQMQDILRDVGRVEVFSTAYNAFRGSRNLRGRALHVREYLYLVER